MIAYVYNVDSREVVEVIEGDNYDEIESKFDWDIDSYGLTYNPAFGASDGLIPN